MKIKPLLLAVLAFVLPAPAGLAHQVITIGNVSLGAGATLTYPNIQSAVRGVGYDAFDVTGTASFFSTSTIKMLLNASYAPQNGDHFELMHFLGTVTGAAPQFNVPALDPGLSWDTSAFFQTGTVAVMATAAPEPASAALLGLGALLLAARRRRSA